MLALLLGMILTAFAQGEFSVDPDEALRALQYRHCQTSQQLLEYKNTVAFLSPSYTYNVMSLSGESGQLDPDVVNLTLAYMEREQRNLFLNWVSVDPHVYGTNYASVGTNVYTPDYAKHTNRIGERHRAHLEKTIRRLERHTDIVQETTAERLVVKIREAAEKEHIIAPEVLRFLEIADNLELIENRFKIENVTEFIPTYPPEGKYDCRRFER